MLVNQCLLTAHILTDQAKFFAGMGIVVAGLPLPQAEQMVDHMLLCSRRASRGAEVWFAAAVVGIQHPSQSRDLPVEDYVDLTGPRW